MVDFLIECGLRAGRPSLMQALMHNATAKYEDDQRVMMDLVTESMNIRVLYDEFLPNWLHLNLTVLKDRRAHPTEKKDLLNVMLSGRDKETGLTLSEESIKKNVIIIDFLFIDSLREFFALSYSRSWLQVSYI